MLIYQIIVLLVAAFAIFRGFKRGFARQTHSVIGVAFGIICCHIFMPPMMEIIRNGFPQRIGHPEELAFYSIMACALIFMIVYSLFTLITSFIGRLLADREYSIMNRIGGACFTLFKYMLFLSIFYSLILAYSPRCSLLKAGQSDDGNATEMVMLLGSSVLGFESVEMLAHKMQLEDAHHISNAIFIPDNLDNTQLRCNFA
jgi:uncharacterized membrane protein required for colicin V production